jgi:hypothetical protein
VTHDDCAVAVVCGVAGRQIDPWPMISILSGVLSSRRIRQKPSIYSGGSWTWLLRILSGATTANGIVIGVFYEARSERIAPMIGLGRRLRRPQGRRDTSLQRGLLMYSDYS